VLAAIFTVGPARAHTLAGGVAGVRPRTHCTYAWGATGAGEHRPHAHAYTCCEDGSIVVDSPPTIRNG